MSDAVDNGPRATSAKTAHIEAKIRHAEAKAKKAHDQAAVYRRKAKGDGPLAKYRKLQADGMDNVADQHRARVNQLRAELAKAKADEAARHVKHVKRTVASTAAEGLVSKAAAQPGRSEAGQGKGGGQPSQAKHGQVAKGPAGSEPSPGRPTCSRCRRPVSRWVYRKGQIICDLCRRPEDDDLGHGKCKVPERVEKRGSIHGRVRADGTRSIDAGPLLGYQTVPCGARATAADGLCDRHRRPAHRRSERGSHSDPPPTERKPCHVHHVR
jgi:hypothetical protein